MRCSNPFPRAGMSFSTSRRAAVRLPPCEPEPRIADARRRAPHSPSEIVTRRRAVLRPLHPTRPCRQHHSAGEVRVFVHQPAARLGNDPLGTEQERHAAMVADAEADQMRRQFLKIAIRQICDDPRESFERRDSRNGEDQTTRLRDRRGATQTTDGHGRRPAPTPIPRSEPTAATPAQPNARR
jgi:hypothetical protein